MTIVKNILLISATILMSAFAIYVIFMVGLFIVDEITDRIDEKRRDK